LYNPSPVQLCPVLPSPASTWAARVGTIMLLLSLSLLSLSPYSLRLGISSQPFTLAAALSLPIFSV